VEIYYFREMNMAKKKKSSVSRPAKKSRTVNIPATEPAPVVTGKSSMLKKILITFFAVFLAANIVELFVFMGKAMHKQNYPVLATQWAHNYTGCTSIGEYGGYIYGIDNTRGDVYINKKDSGQLVTKLNFKEGVYSALEDSAGVIWVLARTGEVLKVDPGNFRTVSRIKPEGSVSASWMDIDSKDNFYIANPSSSVITKYDRNFKKLLAFGGRSEGNDGFFNLGKIFTGPGDEIYCMNYLKTGKLEIKIFASDGKFINAWTVYGIKSFDGLTNMAIAPDGDAYINDSGQSKVFVFNNKGNMLGSFSGTEDKSFSIVYIASITGGKNGLIYVATHDMGVFKTIDYTK
jgi:hypothetical protein